MNLHIQICLPTSIHVLHTRMYLGSSTSGKKDKRPSSTSSLSSKRVRKSKRDIDSKERQIGRRQKGEKDSESSRNSNKSRQAKRASMRRNDRVKSKHRKRDSVSLLISNVRKNEQNEERMDGRRRRASIDLMDGEQNRQDLQSLFSKLQ